MKRRLALIGILFLVLISATICIPVAAFATNESENVEIVITYIDGVMNNKEYDLINELIHPDEFLFRVFHLPGFHQGLPHTLLQHQAFVKAIHENTPDLSITVKDIAADGDVVFTHITTEGTLSEKSDIYAGKTFSWDSIQLFRIKDGKIIDMFVATNNEYVDSQEEGNLKVEKQMVGMPTANLNMTSEPNNVAANVAKAIEFQMAWERNDLESVSAHFHEDYEHTQYPDSGIAFSNDDFLIVQELKESNQPIENYDHKIRDIAADGDVVFTHWVEDGTLKSDGTPYHVEGMTMFKFRNGKIYTSITYTE